MKLETPSLLITDDDRDFRETLRSVFETRGFRTILAGDGEEALDVIKREPVHLLLLDMHMPRLTGLETIRQLRTLHFELPCILISAALDRQLEAEARAAQAFSVLSKPVRLPDITGIVARAMQQIYCWPMGK
ncbi:Response regulator MprA [Anatilimnocola aggregata]|uniref:Response regulator MprA n=1 Tax=Anatilimnocola aggregata TaxID=2528021 RepID=A0A517YI03_9BACT|nr:response regulator [Anatilimnocola aggregata]QDU29841.1 Response regulator MprA [Anatilimnocola aggregata]